MADRQSIGDHEILCDGEGQPLPGMPCLTDAAVLARNRLSGKTVNIEMASGAEGERLAKLAALLQELSHPGIVKIEDWGREDGGVHCVTEHFPQGNLRTAAKARGPFPPGDAAAICRQVAEALCALHAAGLVHGDVKPANLWLADEAAGSVRIKLGGFHLASEAAAPVRAAGNFSPEYASPEQVREEAIDARSDLFSLGMTWWHLLRGGTPLTGPVGTLLSERIDPAKPYSRKLPESLTGPARLLLESLLQKDASRRPVGAESVAAALGEIAAALGGQSKLPPVVQEPAPATTAGAVTSWTDIFSPVDPTQTELVAGDLLPAIDRVTGRHVLLDLQAGAIPEALRIRAATHLANHPQLAALVEIREVREGWLAVWTRPDADDLLSVLRRSGKIPLSDSAGFLAQLAVAFDAARDLGFPAVDARIAEVNIHLPAAGWQEASAILRPIFLPPAAGAAPAQKADPAAPQNPADDAAGPLTMMPLGLNATGSLGGDERFSFTASFASLVYYLTGGRPPALAARISPAALVRISGFSEAGNNLVGRAIAGEFEHEQNCREFLRNLARTENTQCRFPDPLAEAAPPPAAADVVRIPLPPPPTAAGPKMAARPSNDPRLALELLENHAASVVQPIRETGAATSHPVAAAQRPERLLKKSGRSRGWIIGLIILVAVAAAIYLIATKAPHLL